ncbi:MAG: hypothetical protein GX684_00305 [Ruminococcaceae bacterium]|nr:hypothetical protein [Oscillospiraceae bacterium]
MSKLDNFKMFLKLWIDGDISTYDESYSPLLAMDDLDENTDTFDSESRHVGKKNPSHRILYFAVILAGIVLVSQLILTSYFMPRFASPDSPVNNEVTARYVKDGVRDTGAINAVSGMIFDYRAFDTFGESTVLFSATVFVLMLLGRSKPKKSRGLSLKSNDQMLRSTVSVFAPFITVFGVYLVLNGHLSPGGGFAGGTVLGAMLILISAAYGHARVSAFLTSYLISLLMSFALLVYALIKAFAFVSAAVGENLLPVHGNIGSIYSAGFILPLNICVGIVVSLTVFAFYSAFAALDE